MDDYGGWYIKTSNCVPGEWGNGDGYGGMDGSGDGDGGYGDKYGGGFGCGNWDGYGDGSGDSIPVKDHREG